MKVPKTKRSGCGVVIKVVDKSEERGTPRSKDVTYCFGRQTYYLKMRHWTTVASKKW